MITVKLAESGGSAATSPASWRESHMSYHWRFHRKSRNEFAFIVSMYLLGFAILLTLMIYVNSAAR